MRARAREVSERGARLVLIGNGTPEQADAYRREFSGELELLVDPELVGYRAARLKRSLLTSVTPRTAFEFFCALRQGHRPGRTEGDSAQLGGAFVITPEGRVGWSFVSRTLDDKPRLEEVLEALDRLSSRR